MKDVKISYRKAWGKVGTLYNTCVRMDKKVFQSFFKYICDIYEIISYNGLTRPAKKKEESEAK